MFNLITDVPGLLVGHAHDAGLASGVTCVLFEAAATASMAIHGGAPGVRDTALLEPDMTVDGVNALVLSGGSAFGLDSMGGVQGVLRARGIGFRIGSAVVPIVPGAVVFDLLNGGNKAWGRMPPYWELGALAAEAAAPGAFPLGSVGAGLGATTATLKGGLGSASVAVEGFTVGALVAVNALGSATVGTGPHFWAAPAERNGEFGGLGLPHPMPPDAGAVPMKGVEPASTTIGIVATDAVLTKGQAKRLAVMAQDGLARALRPTHATLDGDVVFAAATGRHPAPVDHRVLTLLGTAAADCLARAIARGIYEATALAGPGPLPAWRDRFGLQNGAIDARP